MNYKKNNFYVENVSTEKLSKKFKTPLYCYSYLRLKNNIKKFKNYFSKINPLICFSVKSNSNIKLLKEIKKFGLGADVVSKGEMIKALKAGIKANKIVFSGVGKTEEELKIAINKKILLINCESESEARIINKIAKRSNKKVSIGFRLNPNIDAKTHKKISTGKANNKFGVSIKNFSIFFKEIKKLKNIKLEALSVHIGSQILTDIPYKRVLTVLYKLIKNLDLNLKYIDLGGGFGINYNKKDKPVNLKRYASLVHSFSRKLNCKIIFEPGRSIVGNAGILVSKVEYIKNGANKKFVILNAGMNDFMRPALYDAQHDIIPITKNSKKIKGAIEFVGPICESTCKFGIYKNYQKISENDFVAITNVGAYGSSLSSNYNTRPLIAEILVNKNKFKFIRKKQNLLKLISA